MAEQPRLAAQTRSQAEIEDSFRKVLEDVRDVAAKLQPYCNTIQEMLELVELGTMNDAQLRIILKEVTAQPVKVQR